MSLRFINTILYNLQIIVQSSADYSFSIVAKIIPSLPIDFFKACRKQVNILRHKIHTYTRRTTRHHTENTV